MNVVPAEEDHKNWRWLVVLAAAINIPCLLNGVMEPDGALYASIAKQIALSNNWSDLLVSGRDWLDKPHLPFWAAAASFKIFGINAFAYKLPSFLCFLAGLYYTYRLTLLLLKNSRAAAVATIFYAAALHTILANFDVRAEGYLTAFVSAATFFILQTMQQRSWRSILAAAVFCALAVMTKGIFILIIIFSGFVLYWMLTRQWKQLVNPAWYIIVLLTLIFITPELYCLWRQFDSHPEKIVFGQPHVSGIRFFFWDSQFGRFFNTGPIKGSGDVSFFVHTTLWAYLPWSPVLIAAVAFFIVKRRTLTTIPKELMIITGSALFGFLLFSFSKFQLPHYVVTLFPYFSIIAAAYTSNIASSITWARWNIAMTVVFIIAVLLVSVISFYSKLPSTAGSLALLGISLTAFFYCIKKGSLKGMLLKGLCTSFLLSFFLNLLFYPALLQYQSGMVSGQWLKQQHYTQPVAMYRCNPYSFVFYTPGSVIYANKTEELFEQNDMVRVFTAATEIPALQQAGIKVDTVFGTGEFHVTVLTPEFLDDKTRPQVVDRYVIAECINTKK